MTDSIKEFFAKLRFKWFRWRLDHTIFDRVMPHLQNERDCGFPFATSEQMNDQTRARDLRVFLDLIDRQTAEMPKGYAQAFRYLMHRDLYDRIQNYVKAVQRRVPPRSRIPALM